MHQTTRDVHRHATNNYQTSEARPTSHSSPASAKVARSVAAAALREAVGVGVDIALRVGGDRLTDEVLVDSGAALALAMKPANVWPVDSAGGLTTLRRVRIAADCRRT